MKYQELFEEESKGTFVGIRFGSKTISRLTKWLEEQNISNLTPGHEMHCTIILDEKKKFNWDCEDYKNRLKIDPSTYKLDLFGPEKDILVITFNCHDLSQRHESGIIEHNITWEFPEYIPHITLCQEAKGIDLSQIALPKFPLYVSHEYKQDYDKPTWKK